MYRPYTDDPVADYGAYEGAMAREDAKYPTCYCCGEACDDDYYDVFGHYVCADCMDDMKRTSEVY